MADFDIKVVKGIIICKESGEYIFDLMIDSDLNPILLSSYVGALSLFGIDHLGEINEIIIKGGKQDMVVINDYHLVLLMILDKEFSANYNFRKQAKQELDLFYETYREEINKAVDTSPFEEFRPLLKEHIREYLKNLKENPIFYMKEKEK